MRRIFLAMALALIVSGCVVQSLNPFYTSDIVVPMPAQMQGEWVFENHGDPTDLFLFTFSQKGLRFQDKTGEYEFSTVFFKIGDQLYIDIVHLDPNNRAISLFSWNPHNLVRVVLRDDGIELHWLNYFLVSQWAEEQKLKMFVKREGMISVSYILIAESAEIVRFLDLNKDKPDLIAEKWPLKRSAK